MTPSRRVKGRYSDQSVDALFRLEIAIGVVAVDLKCDALYARFFAIEQVEHLHRKALYIAIARIHPIEHAYPVLRLCSARTCVQ